MRIDYAEIELKPYFVHVEFGIIIPNNIKDSESDIFTVHNVLPINIKVCFPSVFPLYE